MAFLNWLGNAPVHDPIYGIDHANITKELTGSNWRKKAIVRNGLYVWVVRGYRSNGDKRIYLYYVRVHPQGEHKELKKSFAKHDPALAYANGRVYKNDLEVGYTRSAGAPNAAGTSHCLMMGNG